MKIIYLIEKIWVDSMENHFSAAVGYRPVGFVKTEEEALQICKDGKIFTKEHCWAIQPNMPEYKYSIIKEFKKWQI